MFSAVSGCGVTAQRSEHWCALPKALGLIQTALPDFFRSCVPVLVPLSFDWCVDKNAGMNLLKDFGKNGSLVNAAVVGW